MLLAICSTVARTVAPGGGKSGRSSAAVTAPRPRSAAGAEDALGAQQDAEQADDLVDGLSRDLADEVGEGAQQGADDDPQQHVRAACAPRVLASRV